MACIVCLEDIPLDAQVVLEPCHHTACQGCIRNWIETCEEQGHDEAKCPQCRQVMGEATCHAILGRPYQAKSLTADDISQELDDFTLTWLQENGAKQCKNCGAWLTNEEGQEALMCLCGYCYCWACDVSALDCDCGHDEFYDNVTGVEINIRNRDEDSSEFPIVVAAEEDREHFRAFLEARRDAHRNDNSDDDDESTNSEVEPVEACSETSIIEEPAEVDFITIFDQEENAEANFVSIFDWCEEDDDEEEAAGQKWETIGMKRCASKNKSTSCAIEQSTTPGINPVAIIRRVQSA